MNSNKYFIIDFDSTFTKVEALDVLAEISLKDSENKDNVIKEIKAITDKGMDGSMSVQESLQSRLDVLNAHKNQLPELINRLGDQVSPSFKRNTEFINKYKERIFIISNGFKDFIVPIVKAYGIKEEHATQLDLGSGA